VLAAMDRDDHDGRGGIDDDIDVDALAGAD
jgi:hypothetical protein